MTYPRTVANLSDRSIFQSTRSFGPPRLCSLQLQNHYTNTTTEMPFKDWFRRMLLYLTMSALVLKSAQDSSMPISNASLSLAQGTLTPNLSTITNQSELNDVSIKCEKDRERKFGSPRPISCADALNRIPRGANLLFFGERGAVPRGATGLPYRYTSCKP